jgi:hypothetical protein
MIWRDKDDYIGLIVYGILWGIPLLFLIILTIKGEMDLGIVICYEVPALISLILVRPWKKIEPENYEKVGYMIHGSIPMSSRTSRFIMALLPILNILVACALLWHFFKKTNDN